MDAITINGLSKQYNRSTPSRTYHCKWQRRDFWLYWTKCAGINDHQSIVEFYQTRCRTGGDFWTRLPTSSQRDQNVYWYVSSDVRFYSKMTTAELLAFTADFHQVKQPKRDSGVDGAFSN